MLKYIYTVLAFILLGNTMHAQESIMQINGTPVYRQEILPEEDLKESQVSIEVMNKAEMWEERSENNALNASLWEKTWKILPNYQGENNFDQKACSNSQNGEFALLMDVTGSMAAELEVMKALWPTVLQELKSRKPEIHWHTANLFFRDEAPGAVKYPKDFQNLETVGTLLNLTRAGGGGDQPENWPLALTLVVDSLKWSPNAAAKFLVLAVDAAPEYSEAIAGQLRGTIQQAKAIGIHIIPIAGLEADEELLYLLKSLALGTGGIFMQMKTSHTNVPTAFFGAELATLIAEPCSSEGKMLQNIGELTCFPNPAHQYTDLKLPEIAGQLRIWAVNGRLVYDQPKVAQSQIRLDLKGWIPAVYTVEFRSGNKVYQGRFVKE